MEREKGPPDRRKPSQQMLIDAVRFACHQPKYRCALRKDVVVLEYLDVLNLNAILAACDIDKRMCSGADDARGMIRCYLQRHEGADCEWLKRRQAANTSQQLEMDVDCDAERDGVQYSAVSKDESKSESSGEKSKSEPKGTPTSGDSLKHVALVLTAAAEALAAAAQFISSLSEEQQSSTTVVSQLVSSLEKTSAATVEACASLSSVSRAPKTASYAQVASNVPRHDRKVRSVMPKKLTASLRATRQQIALEKKNLRDDRRSIKLKPKHPKGALEFGALARAVATQLRADRSDLASRGLKEIVEDVRMDARGQYYVQFPGEDLQAFTSCLRKKSTREPFTDDDRVLTLPDLGDFQLRSPTVAGTAGMTPMVITGIPVDTSPSAIMDELWSANHASWGLASADRDKHFAGLSRLQIRHQSANQSSVEYQDSRSVKIFVSRTVTQNFKSGVGMVRYEYSHLPIRPFEQPQKLCSQCGAMTRHSAATCRSQKRTST